MVILPNEYTKKLFSHFRLKNLDWRIDSQYCIWGVQHSDSIINIHHTKGSHRSCYSNTDYIPSYCTSYSLITVHCYSHFPIVKMVRVLSICCLFKFWWTFFRHKRNSRQCQGCDHLGRRVSCHSFMGTGTYCEMLCKTPPPQPPVPISMSKV